MMPAPDTEHLRAAARWYVLLCSSSTTPQQQQAWQQWHDSHPQHAAAWEKATRLQASLQGLPAGLARETLSRQQQSRRMLLKRCAVLLGSGGLAWLASRHSSAGLSDIRYHTARGKRLEQTLPDGSHLLLNTDSDVVVAYDQQQRTVRLLRGELRIITATDRTQPARDFVVETAHGRITALGTRFTVRTASAYTDVAVQEHAVLIQPWGGGDSLRLLAGDGTRFDQRQSGQPHPLPAGHDSWTRGQLIVTDMPLGQLVQELARYRDGTLHCDPRIAGLTLSGTFSLDHPQRSLQAITAFLPVVLVEHGRWATLIPASDATPRGRKPASS